MNDTKHGKFIESKICVVIFSANFFFSVTFFILRRIEQQLHSYLCACNGALPSFFLLLLRIRESTPSDLRRFSLRENSFDAVTVKLVKFQLPDRLTVEILLQESWAFTPLSSYDVVSWSVTYRINGSKMAVWRISYNKKEEADSVRRRVNSTVLLLKKLSKTWTILCLARWPVGCRCICN